MTTTTGTRGKAVSGRSLQSYRSFVRRIRMTQQNLQCLSRLSVRALMNAPISLKRGRHFRVAVLRKQNKMLDQEVFLESCKSCFP